MDSFEFNKIAGAVLGTALAVFGLKELATEIYHADAPEKPGMMIEVAEAATPSGDEAAAEAPAMSMAKMMASANVDIGPSAMKKCKSCHNWSKGGKDKVGPNLWDIVGSNIAAGDGFKYSSALKAKASDVWSYEALNAFLKKPQEFAPKTKMSFSGEKDDTRRMDIIAFLRMQSDDPKPLPTE